MAKGRQMLALEQASLGRRRFSELAEVQARETTAVCDSDDECAAAAVPANVPGESRLDVGADQAPGRSPVRVMTGVARATAGLGPSGYSPGVMTTATAAPGSGTRLTAPISCLDRVYLNGCVPKLQEGRRLLIDSGCKRRTAWQDAPEAASNKPSEHHLCRRMKTGSSVLAVSAGLVIAVLALRPSRTR
jgi:hypothetical protein